MALFSYFGVSRLLSLAEDGCPCLSVRQFVTSHGFLHYGPRNH